MYVYFIKGGSHIKIGVTSNIEKRIAQIQTGCPHVTELIASVSMPSRLAAHDFERFLHIKFDKFRVSGEWFKIRRSALKLNKLINHYEQSNFLKVDSSRVAYGSKERQKEKEYNFAALSMQKDRLVALLKKNKIDVPEHLITSDITVSKLRKMPK